MALFRQLQYVFRLGYGHTVRQGKQLVMLVCEARRTGLRPPVRTRLSPGAWGKRLATYKRGRWQIFFSALRAWVVAVAAWTRKDSWLPGLGLAALRWGQAAIGHSRS